MSYETPKLVNVDGRVIKIAHLELPENIITQLAVDALATGTSLTVLDNSGFSDTDLILIGDLGEQQTEIKKVNAAVTYGTAITSTALTFNHAAGSQVMRILFNQWKIYGNSTNTSVGAVLLATVDMQVNKEYTTYVNTGTEYAYYLVLPYNSETSVTGDSYSDGVAQTGYTELTVGSIVESALDSTNKKLGGKITEKLLIREINDCMDYISTELKRMSYLQSFNYVLGQTAQGTKTYTLPTDIIDKNTNKGILDVRLNGQTSLQYVDKREMNELQTDLSTTTVRTQAVATDTSLAVVNSYDFADSGTLTFFISGTKYELTYTAVTRSTTAGAFTGIPATGDGAITVTIPVGTVIYANYEESAPENYTVYDGSLEIWPFPDASNAIKNILLDYFTLRTRVDTFGDSIETNRYGLVKHWLCWKLRSLDNANGELSMEDGDKKMFDMMLSKMIRKEISGQKYKMKPKVNGITY